ncbi:sensor histidine kinase [Fibrella forsythiae]|uniref:histidine kinase n=1 Tax=Fibrella forsythiae TaxID=2817061 RepID=A0ABS3JP83_9BACT|nr:PAS domain-containing sensor histidine kinase [Fibrella forsythiae]MBO0951810.1 PAS domain S-box protein [Fibrella forsythiae]
MFFEKGEATLAELLFEESDDFIGIYNVASERFVRVNTAGIRLLGFASEDAFLNDPAWSHSFRTSQLTDDQRTNLINRVIEHGHHDEVAELQRLNGEPFWGHLKINSFNNKGHLFVIVRMLDRERLHRAELELKQSVQRYEAVFTNATIGIIVSNQRGQIVSLNQMARQLFGYPDDSLIGKSIDLLVPSDVEHGHAKLRASFVNNPQVRSMGHNRDLNARRHDGSVFPVEVSLSYFRLDDELYVVAYIIDITFKKEAERQLLAHRDHIERLNADLEQKVADRTHALMNTLDQLEQSKDELARALAAERELGELKSRFVAMASHEFRTPLTAVLTSATLIEKYPGSDQQDKRQKHLLRIRASVNHLNDILEEFLSVGRLEEGKVAIHPVEVDLARLVDETILDMQGLLKPDQRIQTEISCNVPVWLDPSLLRKILVNLLSNAVKYSGPGSVVTVRGSGAGGQLTITVEDQGMGIAPDDQEHLFERFFRAKNVANIAGTGLGLHIVGRYVDLMNGHVSLQSELNKGTIVTLTLPYENNSANRG